MIQLLLKKIPLFLSFFILSTYVSAAEIGDQIGSPYGSSWSGVITSLSPRECKLTRIDSWYYRDIPEYLEDRDWNRYKVTSIGPKVIVEENYRGYYSIKIPSTVRTVESSAFQGLNIYELVIPESVTWFSSSALYKASGFKYILDKSGTLPPPQDIDQYKDAYVVTTADNRTRLKRPQTSSVNGLTVTYKDLSVYGLSTWNIPDNADPYYLFKEPVDIAYIELGKKFKLGITSIPSIPHFDIIEGEDLAEMNYYLETSSSITSTPRFTDPDILKYNAGQAYLYIEGKKPGIGKLRIYNEIGDTIIFPFVIIEAFPNKITLPSSLEVPINTDSVIHISTEPEKIPALYEWSYSGDKEVRKGLQINADGTFCGTVPGHLSVCASIRRTYNTSLSSNWCDMHLYDKNQLELYYSKSIKNDTVKMIVGDSLSVETRYLGGISLVKSDVYVENPSIIQINDDGYIKGISGGTTRITFSDAENPEVNKTFVLKILQLPTSIEWEIPQSNVYVGDTIRIGYKILPENLEYEKIECFWSEKLYKLEEDNCFKAYSSGEASLGLTIDFGTVVDNFTHDTSIRYHSPSFTINDHLSSISVSTTEFIKLNKTEEIEITVSPSSCFEYELLVESSDPNIISIEKDERGIYFYRSNNIGKATINVHASDGTKILNRTKDIYVYSLEWNDESTDTNLAVGDSSSISLVLKPDDFAKDFKDFHYYFYGSRIDIDKNGHFTATKAGTGIIDGHAYIKYLTSLNLDSYYLQISDPEIILSSEQNNLDLGHSIQLYKECVPYEFFDGKWETSDATIATVDDEGIVTGIAPGSVSISYIGYTKGGIQVNSSYDLIVNEIQISTIELPNENVQLTIGEVYQFEPEITPLNATEKIIWSSSNPDIVLVDEKGLVTALNVGKVIITASSSNTRASCMVEVNPVAASSITLNVQEIFLLVEQSYQLKATVYPENTTDKTVTWRSSDIGVATVNQEGLVTAVSPGTAVITASDAYGHNAMVTVKVKEDDIPVEIPATGISITPSTPEELNVGESLQLTATVSPENATDKTVTWQSSDIGVATVNQQGLVTAVSPGTAVITASDDYGHNAFAIITVIAPEDTGIETMGPEAEKFYILTVDGILIKKDATQEDINTLAPGLYIIGGKKVVVK